MKNWISLCLTCCWAFGSLATSAQVPPTPAVLAPDTAYPQDVAQDSGGQLWGAIGDGLYRWMPAGEWRRVPALAGVIGRPDALAHLPSGAVACLWDRGDGDHVLTAHRGAVSRVVARFSGFLRAPHLFGDHAGNVWAMGLGGDIYRASARVGDMSPAEHVLTIADADYYPGYQRSNFGGDQGREAGLFYHDPLYGAEDGQGRMCFWTDRLAGGGNFAALRGILRWENGKLVHHASLADLPDKPLTWVARRDSGHLWVALENAGVYEVDAETLRGIPVPAPTLNAFQSVQKMFALGPDWYVVAGGSTNMHPGRLDGTLWRLRAGRWRRLIDGLDSQTVFQDVTRRPVLQTAAGLWVGAFGSGAWLIPAGGGPPVQLDWHYGYRLANTDRLFALPPKTGGVVAFRWGAANGGVVVPAQTHLEARIALPPSGLVRTLMTNHPLVQDPGGRIWNLDQPPGGLPQAGTARAANLSDWDGEKWTPHPLPVGADPAEAAGLDCDSRGRLWLTPYLGAQPARPVFIFDPAGVGWKRHRDYDSALLAQTDTPGLVIRAVAFSSGGRVAYRDDNWHLHFFDGHIWHVWARPDIIPHDTLFAFDPPFFGHDGGLRVNIDHDGNLPDAQQKSWAWTADAGWHQSAYEGGPDDFAAQTKKSLYMVPPKLPITPDTFSIAQDSLGTYWLTSGHVVYRATATESRAAFPPGLPTPFADGRRITGAMTDPQGGTFLLTENGNAREYVFVPPPDGAIPRKGPKP
jgi:hypothetical protein